LSLLEKAMEKYQCVETTESGVESVDNWSEKLRKCPDELRCEAEDDWGWVSADDATLIGFADSLAIVQIREQGRIPDNYTATAICRKCGPVPFYESSFLNLEACVWCMNGQTPPPLTENDR